MNILWIEVIYSNGNGNGNGTVENTVISLNFLMWKFFGKTVSAE